MRATIPRSYLPSFAFATLVASQRNTEAQEASITDPYYECSYYSYPAVADLASGYPTIWQTADLSGAGISDYDKNLFAALNSSIPDIAPHGTRTGDFAGVVYDGATDPDCWWSYTKCDTPKQPGLPPDITRCDEPNTWGFTLDDGPNCSHNAYYDYLQSANNQKATLFYIGSNVMDWPLEGQRGLADGHEICAHTWSHPYMTAMTNEQAFAELYYSKKAIRDIIGLDVQCWRPPYGDVDDRIRYIANALGMVTIVWEEDTFDWQVSTIGVAAVQNNYNNVFAKQANGSFNTHGTIVLSHELNAETMNISQVNLPTIQKDFVGGVMPVAMCMNFTSPYANKHTNYTYPDYAEYMAGTHSVSLAAPSAVTQDVRLAFTSILPTTTSTSSSSSIPTSITSVTVMPQNSATTSGKGSSSVAPTATHSATSSGQRLSAVGAVLGIMVPGFMLSLM